MNAGNVFCLDTVQDTFVETKGKYEIARTERFSMVDLRQSYCLSVSEKGVGTLHFCQVKSKVQKNYLNPKKNKVTMDLLYSFSISEKVSLSLTCLMISIETTW